MSFLAALLLYYFAIGEVKGFAYTLGLTTLIDIVVVFLFTKPMVTLLARTRFFGNGHPMSGLDPARLGAEDAVAFLGPSRPGQAQARSRDARHSVVPKPGGFMMLGLGQFGGRLYRGEVSFDFVSAGGACGTPSPRLPDHGPDRLACLPRRGPGLRLPVAVGRVGDGAAREQVRA